MGFDGQMQAAVRAIARGCSAEEKDAAPLIEDWLVIGRHGDLCLLSGDVSAHPNGGVKGDTYTSQLLFLDPAAGVARTRSRWYRLGNPMDPEKGSYFEQMGRRKRAELEIASLSEAAIERALDGLVAEFNLRGYCLIDQIEATERMESTVSAVRRQMEQDALDIGSLDGRG